MKSNPHTKLVYNRVAYYRKRLMLTQTELAYLVGSTKNTISAIETGIFCPSLPLVYSLCYCLHVSFYDLFVPSDGFLSGLNHRSNEIFPTYDVTDDQFYDIMEVE